MNIFHHTVFPSIITETQCDLYRYIRNDLIEWIYNYQLKTDNVIISNRGGWQSPSNFYDQESFSEFKNYIMSNVFQSLTHYNKKFKLANMWININKKGVNKIKSKIKDITKSKKIKSLKDLESEMNSVKTEVDEFINKDLTLFQISKAV